MALGLERYDDDEGDLSDERLRTRLFKLDPQLDDQALQRAAEDQAPFVCPSRHVRL
ncbi:hypothetical protein [Aurantimonas sp. HBX-1]|uniref:hypothetical protein n=1 Tax=Aurantimonas sp. HBX-1 TaxID=2906072 RepID=UPI001F170A76|nr:hypothetical protein [Aurantimonas sp. HBX-1]UIJ73333.1 hypothetical protein LXB15_06735 [Aurantimonas sp. HBX-1]